MQEQLERLVEQAAALQGPGRIADRQRKRLRRQRLARSLAQEFLEQGVVAIDMDRGRAALDEEVAPIEVLQHPARAAGCAHAFGEIDGHARQERGRQQHLLDVGRRTLEDLAGEVVECRFAAVQLDGLGVPAHSAQAIQREHAAGRPAAHQRLDAIRQGLVAAAERARQAAAFLRRQAQRVGCQHPHALLGDQRAELHQRCAAADDEHVDAVRNLFDRLFDQDLHDGRGIDVFVVVEDDDRRRRQQREQGLEAAPGKARHVGQELAGQQRQFSALPASERRGGLSQVVEKRRRVAVAFVDVVPEGGQAAGGQVAGDERALARAGWPLDPQRRPFARRVQQHEEPLARERVEQAGWPQLGELRALHAGYATAARGSHLGDCGSSGGFGQD